MADVEDGMPFKYERDDVRHRIAITFEGAFQMSEALASIGRRRAEHAWSQGVLYDLRYMTGHPDMEELQQLLREELSFPTGGKPRGPLAVVATAASLYTKACTFAALAQSRVKVGVFRDRSEADSWLTTHLDNRSPSPKKRP